MEPVTHLLTGACLARTGFHRRIAYATVAMAAAAEFPDIDTLWSLRGPIAGFEHHRGITHTFAGIPFEAAFLLLLVYAWHRMRLGRTQRGRRPTRPEARPPLRWAALYGAILLALLSHLLLDYTNNYGLRPFLPFNDRWYAGSIVFIFDPLIFGLLVAGLVLPSLFALVNRELGVRGGGAASPGWALTVLTGVLALWTIRTYEHGRAVGLAQATTLRAPATGDLLAGPVPDSARITNFPAEDSDSLVPASTRPLLQAARSLASPDPLSVFRWYTATDYGGAYRLGVADTRVGTWDPGRLFANPVDPEARSLNAYQSRAALEAAKRSHLGRVYLDWSPMPILSLRDAGSTRDEVSGARAVVHFADPRFMGDTFLLRGGDRPPLSGEVFLGAGDVILAESLDGRFGH